METLVKQLATEMMARGLSSKDTKLAIGCLETKEQFKEMLAEVRKQKTLTRSGALAIAVVITDEEE